MHCGLLVLEGSDAHAGKDGVKLVHFCGCLTCAYNFLRKYTRSEYLLGNFRGNVVS